MLYNEENNEALNYLYPRGLDNKQIAKPRFFVP